MKRHWLRVSILIHEQTLAFIVCLIGRRKQAMVLYCLHNMELEKNKSPTLFLFFVIVLFVFVLGRVCVFKTS